MVFYFILMINFYSGLSVSKILIISIKYEFLYLHDPLITYNIHVDEFCISVYF